MKAHRDWKLPEDSFGPIGGSLERGGAVDHDRDARSFTEVEPGGLQHGAPERGDRDHDCHLVKIGSCGDSLRIELPCLRIDIGDPERVAARLSRHSSGDESERRDDRESPPTCSPTGRGEDGSGQRGRPGTGGDDATRREREEAAETFLELECEWAPAGVDARFVYAA